MPDVESASIKIPNPRRNANVRAYLAGGGATAALVAAAVIVFIGVAAFVGFNGLPFGAEDSPDASVGPADARGEGRTRPGEVIRVSLALRGVRVGHLDPEDVIHAEILAAVRPGSRADRPHSGAGMSRRTNVRRAIV